MDRVLCGTCGGEFRAKKDGTPYKHACKPVASCAECGWVLELNDDGSFPQHGRSPGVICKPRRICVAGYPGECGEPVTTSGAFRCDDHLCARSTNCLDCWEEDETPAVADALLNNLVGMGMVVPGNPAETHRRMLAGGPCHNGPTCPYCKPSEPEPVSVPAATVPSMDDTKKTEADAFLSPTPAADSPQEDAEVKRDQWQRYLLPHPRTGLYSDGRKVAGKRNGWMRATTFAKAAADTFSLTRYNERLTLLGASMRPDVVALAHGKDVRQHRGELDRLVDEVKNAAGAKVAANLGMAVHSFTERYDSGSLALADVPEAYRDHVQRYAQTLHAAGLECVPGLIERTTFAPEFNVAGTLDRVYRLPDGTYAIGDLKTGRTLEYGQMEIAVQLAFYEHGVNAAGVYDWGAGAWEEGPKVRTDIAIVVHLPVQGDLAGTCTIKTVDLEAGHKAAEVARDVLRARKGDYMRDGLVLPPAGEPEEDWGALFAAVTSSEEANELYRRARSAGLSLGMLQPLVAIGREALASRD